MRSLAAVDNFSIGEKERESVGVPIAQSLARLAETQQAAQQAGEIFEEDQQTMFQILQRDVAELSSRSKVRHFRYLMVPQIT